MSTTTPSDGDETERGARTEPDDRSTRSTTGTGRPDRWADSAADARERASPAAPLTFDPLCTRRIRSFLDAENAVLPDAPRGGDPRRDDP